MKISGSYVVPAPRAQTYALLQDPVILARCMPGTERLNRIGDDHYEMKMKMVIAAISGSFDGTVRLADQNPPESFRLIMEGAGKIGFVKGEGLLKLNSQDDSATTVNYEGEVHVGGSIAAVGQRLLDATSKMVLKNFFGKLSAEASKPQGSSPSSSPTSTGAAASGPVE